MTSFHRPDPTECASYFGKYVDAAAGALEAMDGASVVDLLTVQPVMLRDLLRGLTDDGARSAYAPGKWTLAESLVHVSDAERVFSYRLLRIARGDTTPLPGFEQDAWVPASGANERSLADILTEIDVVRASTLALAYSLTDEALARVGTASNNPISARALLWIIAGHMSHHLQVTRERYLAALRAD